MLVCRAIYKVDFLADGAVIDSQEIRPESRTKNAIHALIGIEKIRQSLGKVVSTCNPNVLSSVFAL